MTTSSAPQALATSSGVVDQVGDGDVRRPLGAGGEGGEAADRPRAGDHHAAAEHLAGPLDRVQADGERLGAGRDPPGHGVGDDVALVGARDHVLGERALDMREDRGAAEEPHVAAEIAAPGAAVVAGEAGPARVDRHPVAGLEARDGGAGLDDLPGDLVAEHQRLLEREVADPPLEVVGEVGAADAAGAEREAHLVVEERSVLDRLQLQVLGPMQNGRQHRVSSSCYVEAPNCLLCCYR